MSFSDVRERLAEPFPASLLSWKPQSVARDRRSAVMVAYVDARTVMDRLDAVCPDAWQFDADPIPGLPQPTVRGRLTVMGLTRGDIGEAGEGEAGTFKAAASDALKRCAVHFGIGRYLYALPPQSVEWDEEQRAPAQALVLPEWAKPVSERSPGTAHVLSALDQLRLDLPDDVAQLREVYRHLRAALGAAGLGG